MLAGSFIFLARSFVNKLVSSGDKSGKESSDPAVDIRMKQEHGTMGLGSPIAHM